MFLLCLFVLVSRPLFLPPLLESFPLFLLPGDGENCSSSSLASTLAGVLLLAVSSLLEAAGADGTGEGKVQCLFLEKVNGLS